MLIASPLLGPAVWRPVADLLADQGWPVHIMPPPEAEATTPDLVLAGYRRRLAGVASPDGVVLVPHSNAGLYVPALALARQVAGYLFVDAGLPPAGNQAGPSVVSPAGGEFLDFLAGLAGDAGVLPPWTQWWPPEDIASAFPDPGTRAAVEAEQRRLPLNYFTGTVPVPPGWDDRPAGYLAFGETYADDRERAAGRGWPVRTMTGGHLHQLVEPRQVATVMVELLDRMLAGDRAPRSSAATSSQNQARTGQAGG